MSFHSLRPEIPSVITSCDRETKGIISSTIATCEASAQRCTPRDTVLESRPAPTTTPAAIQDLQCLLPSSTQLLRPFVDEGYDVATYIGNLLYSRMTPAAVAIPHTVQDAIEIVKFARERNIQLTVKGGGHSYAGYCLNHDGIVLDMSGLKQVDINKDGTEITIQAGCLWRDVYAKLERRNLTNMIIGGQCPFVGVAGFTLGGGLSPFSRSYGLGIDNVTEMTMITAAGKLVTVNHQDTDSAKRDLFWALRGGGGGNFGVLVEFKSRVHELRDPRGKIVSGDISWELPQQESEFQEMMEVFNNTNWPNELTMDAIWRYRDNQLFGDLTVIYNGNYDECIKVIQPLLDFKPKNNLKERMWHEWVVIEEGFDTKSPVYHHHASFIFGQGGITPTVTKAIISLMKESFTLLEGQGKSHVLWDHIGGKTTEVAPDHTPFFWRQGVYVSNFKLQWNRPEMKPKMLAFIDKVKKTLLPHALGGKAAYLNYIDSTVQNWQEAYYGDNYPRLQRVKSQWDPNNFFHFPQSVEPERRKEHPVPVREVQVASNGARGMVDGSLALLNGSMPLSSLLQHSSSNVSALTSNQAFTKHVPEGPTAIERTSEHWDKYSLSDPDSLWNLEEPTDEMVWNIIGAERAKMIISAEAEV